jgi:ABC-type amino acid transport substrate-binding protein
MQTTAGAGLSYLSNSDAIADLVASRIDAIVIDAPLWRGSRRRTRRLAPIILRC